MSITTLTIPVPASGDGAAVDVSSLVGPKTIVLSGRFSGLYDLMVSQDGLAYVPAVQFDSGGSESVRLTVPGAFRWVRLRSSAQATTAMSCEVSAVSGPGQNAFVTIANLTSGFGGYGPIVDTSIAVPPSGSELDTCFLCRGGFVGQLVILGSADGVDFTPVGQYTVEQLPPGATVLEFSPLLVEAKLRYFRVLVNGTVVGGLTVTMGGRVPNVGSSSGVASIDNIADLRLWPTLDGQVLVAGYYAPADGGGGSFAWDSASVASDNGGTVILPTGHVGPGRWVRTGYSYLSTLYFGILEDLLVDSTSRLQAAIDATEPGGILDCGDRAHTVTTLRLHSDLTLQHCRLVTKAGPDNTASPISIGSDGDTSIKSNIRLIDVHVDGNRANQTGLINDGSRHGFRVLGHVNGLTLIRCSGNNCATDGISIYPGSGTGGSWPWAQNIRMEDCEFTGNRRLGMSGAGFRYMYAENTKYSYNGLAAGAQPGIAPGWGVDIEADDPTWATESVEFLRCEFAGNAAQGFLCYAKFNAPMCGQIYFTDCGMHGDVRFAVDPSVTPTVAIFSRVGVTGGQLTAKIQWSYVLDGFVSPVARVGGNSSVDVGDIDHCTNVSLDASTGRWMFGAGNKDVRVQGTWRGTVPASGNLNLGLEGTWVGNLRIATLTPTPSGQFMVDAYVAPGVYSIVANANGAIFGAGLVAQLASVDGIHLFILNNTGSSFQVALTFLGSYPL